MQSIGFLFKGRSGGSVGPGYVLLTGRVNAKRAEGMTVDPTRMTRTVWSVAIGLPFPETGVNQDSSNRAVIYVTRPASQWARLLLSFCRSRGGSNP
jgi:hypothetical protein